MPADKINSYDSTLPSTSTAANAFPTDLGNNYKAIEEMVGPGIKNLIVSQASTTTVTVTADRLILFNTSSPPLCFSALSINKTADITLSGAGGLDTGSAANSTWYFIWIIEKTSDGSGNAMFSLSATTPTMPSGYAFKRLVGAVYRNASGEFLAFVQRGNRITYKLARTLGSSLGATSYTQIAMSAFVPSIAKRGFGRAVLANSISNEYTLLFLADDASGNYWINVGGICRVAQGYTVYPWEVELVSDINLYYKVQAVTGTPTAQVDIMGYWIEI